MKKKLDFKEILLIGSLLFGLYFGAGNLIFPLELGQKSGYNLTPVTIGFLISGVGLPVIGIVAAALTDSESLFEMVRPAGDKFAYFMTILLYLTIGPGFAIPRTATVSYEVSLKGVLNISDGITLFIFSMIFFALALYFALNRGKLVDTIGKYMTPIFLVLLAILVIFSLVNPMGPLKSIEPTKTYANSPFVKGIVDGYNTLDAPASLAFAVIIIGAVKELGIKEPSKVASETFKSGLVCLVGMSLVYAMLAILGSESTAIFPIQENGALVLAKISHYYLGKYGHILLSLIVTLACLKTCIGLISACSEMFNKLLKFDISYEKYCFIFAGVSFLIANLGLNKIISLSIPVLMFLYPLCIVLIILSLLSKKLGKNQIIYKWTLGFTCIAAFFDFLKNSPEVISKSNIVEYFLALPKSVLPGFDLGFSWLSLGVIGFIIGFIIDKSKNKSKIWYSAGS